VVFKVIRKGLTGTKLRSYGDETNINDEGESGN